MQHSRSIPNSCTSNTRPLDIKVRGNVNHLCPEKLLTVDRRSFMEEAWASRGKCRSPGCFSGRGGLSRR